MNGFEDMMNQSNLEDFISSMDQEFNEKIPEDRVVLVSETLNSALDMLDGDGSHPIERGVWEVIRSAYVIFVLSCISSPTVVGLLARDVVLPAIKFNEKAEPLIREIHARMEKEISGN